MKAHNAEAWLVNTGWMGGPYGTGNRIDLPSTSRIINAILNDSIKNCEFITLPVFNLRIPAKIDGLDMIIFLIRVKHGNQGSNGILLQLIWLSNS